MKQVAMIPALLGSTRIPDKNLLMVDGSPMLFYVAQACKESGVFDEIYVNSEHETFGRMAKMLGVQFYRRKPERGGSACRMRNKSRDCQGSRCQTHEHFLFDFMETLGPCRFALVHTTSPLVRPETIREFMATFERERYDSLFSVEERYAETFYGGNPLNFSMTQKIPTQTLQPLQIVTWALSGWKTDSFTASYREDQPGERGPTFCGKTGVFVLNRIEALDADTQDELYMIDACLRSRRCSEQPGQFRFTEQMTGIERCLEDLIARDGVVKFEDGGASLRLSNLEEIKARMGPPPWLYVLQYTPAQQIALICQPRGQGARKHCHVTHAEWWMILQGTFEWRLGDGTVIQAKKSDVVAIPRGMTHTIVCTSQEPGIRLAFGTRNMEHVYVE